MNGIKNAYRKTEKENICMISDRSEGRGMKRDRGFTLIELLIVVAIIVTSGCA